MFILFEREFNPSRQAYPHRLLSFMYKPDAGYPNLQTSFIASQEYSRFQPFDISHGRFPLMEDAGEDVYNGWMVDAFAPAEFWLTRRQEIIDGKAPDSAEFIPLLPDLYNLTKHPRAVIKAVKEWTDARKKHGDNFQFVFISDEMEQKYIKTLYVFPPDDTQTSGLIFVG